jgi:hypothetical protein
VVHGRTAGERVPALLATPEDLAPLRGEQRATSNECRGPSRSARRGNWPNCGRTAVESRS